MKVVGQVYCYYYFTD